MTQNLLTEAEMRNAEDFKQVILTKHTIRHTDQKSEQPITGTGGVKQSQIHKMNDLKQMLQVQKDLENNGELLSRHEAMELKRAIAGKIE